MITRIVRTSTRDCFGIRAIWACKATMAVWNFAIFTSSRSEDSVVGQDSNPVSFPTGLESCPTVASSAEAHFAADDHGLCPATHLPAAEGAVAALGAKFA